MVFLRLSKHSGGPLQRGKTKLAGQYVEAANSADLAAEKIQEVQSASRAGAESVASVFEGLASGALTAEQAVGRLILQIIKLSLKKRLLETAENSSGFLGGFFRILGGGFSSGGFTGHGGKYEPAGVVHRGEYVMSKEATQAIGVGNLERLHRSARRGYSGGGLVSGPGRASNVPTGRSGGSEPVVNISAPITVNGSAGTPDQNSDLAKKMAKEFELTARGLVTDELRRQMRPGNLLNSRRQR